METSQLKVHTTGAIPGGTLLRKNLAEIITRRWRAASRSSASLRRAHRSRRNPEHFLYWYHWNSDSQVVQTQAPKGVVPTVLENPLQLNQQLIPDWQTYQTWHPWCFHEYYWRQRNYTGIAFGSFKHRCWQPLFNFRAGWPRDLPLAHEIRSLGSLIHNKQLDPKCNSRAGSRYTSQVPWDFNKLCEGCLKQSDYNENCVWLFRSYTKIAGLGHRAAENALI